MDAAIVERPATMNWIKGPMQENSMTALDVSCLDRRRVIRGQKRRLRSDDRTPRAQGSFAAL